MAPILASTRGVGVGAWRSAYAPTHADANISQYERSHVEARMLTYAPAHMALKSEIVVGDTRRSRLCHLSLAAASWLAGRCFMADLLDAAEDDAGAEVPAAAG